MNDRRTTPANARVANVSLRGKVTGVTFVEGDWACVAAPLADLMTAPRGKRDRQVIYGERVLVLERRGHMGFVRAEKDGFCGYVAQKALGPDIAPTHWVAVPATHIYSGPSIKSADRMGLSLGAKVRVVATYPKLLETSDGGFIPRPHLREIGDWAKDPATIAESLLGTPYLWGGNTRSGIDCSGLVQSALTACGIPCPGDSDQQITTLGRDLAPGDAYQRNDLFFWKGHVAMAISATALIHANGHKMAVSVEGIDDCIARIDAQGEGPVLAVRRL